MLLPNYQSNDIENYLALILKTSLAYTRCIKLGSVTHLTSISLSCHTKWKIFGSNPLLKNLKSESNKQESPLFAFLTMMKLGCVHILCPLNKLFIHTWEKTFPIPQGQHMLKRIEVIAVKETYQGRLLVILRGFFKFLEGNLFTEFYTESVRSDRFQPRKILNIVEHASYSIRYCKISFLIQSRRSTPSTAGLSLTHPVQTGSLLQNSPNFPKLLTKHYSNIT